MDELLREKLQAEVQTADRLEAQRQAHDWFCCECGEWRLDDPQVADDLPCLKCHDPSEDD